MVTYVPSLNFKTCCFRYWGESHVAVSISLLYLHFSPSLLQFQPIFVSFVAISAARCRCFKAMSLNLSKFILIGRLWREIQNALPVILLGPLGGTEQGSQRCFTDITEAKLLLWCRLQVQVTRTQKWYFVIHNNQCQESYFPHVHFVYLCRTIPFTIQPIPPPTPMYEIFQGRIWKLFLREQLCKWGVWEKHSLPLKRNI